MRTLFRKNILASLTVIAVGSFTALHVIPSSHGVMSETQASPSSNGMDMKMLRREFKLAQEAEMKTFEQNEKNEAQRFKLSQTNRRNEFETTERAARRKFFADPHPGPEKRDYMKALIERREELRQSLVDEKAKFQTDAEARLENIVDDQQKKRKEFEEAIKRGERPADQLWPQPTAKSEPSPL